MLEIPISSKGEDVPGKTIFFGEDHVVDAATGLGISIFHFPFVIQVLMFSWQCDKHFSMKVRVVLPGFTKQVKGRPPHKSFLLQRHIIVVIGTVRMLQYLGRLTGKIIGIATCRHHDHQVPAVTLLMTEHISRFFSTLPDFFQIRFQVIDQGHQLTRGCLNRRAFIKVSLR